MIAQLTGPGKSHLPFISSIIYLPPNWIHKGPGGCSVDWLDTGLYGRSTRAWEAHQGGFAESLLSPQPWVWLFVPKSAGEVKALGVLPSPHTSRSTSLRGFPQTLSRVAAQPACLPAFLQVCACGQRRMEWGGQGCWAGSTELPSPLRSYPF